MGGGVFVSKTTQYDGGGGGLDQIRQNTTRGEGGSKNRENHTRSFMDGPLHTYVFLGYTGRNPFNVI